jgi:branched-chain amino acid transport system permease protein
VDEILLFIVLGLGSGALIAGISLGVVLTYRGSGIINLSVGAFAMLGGYAFWALSSGKIASLPTGVALVLALVFVVACGALVEFAVFRPLRNSSPLSKMVSSLGVLLIAQSAMLLAFGTTPQPEPTVLPVTGFHLFGSLVGWDVIILAAGVLVVTAGLWAVYKWTKFGLATRAASENETAASSAGSTPPASA